jgi:geranylgeranyl transferase type-2 subunit alpha
MCTFDPDLAGKTMAPNLSTVQRRQYLSSEREFVEDLLEDASDSKWVYQSLIELAVLEAKLDGSMSADTKSCVLEWIEKLKTLDPLRRGRWLDLERTVTTLS